MYFSRKIIPIVLLILLGFCSLGAAFADPYIYMPEHQTYTKGDGSHVIDDAEARRLLQSVGGINLKEVWFATGLDDYYKTPSCVTARDVYVFTKPIKSSDGIWRGRRTYLSGEAKDWTDKDCNDVVLKERFSSDTASFEDPDDMRPEESIEGRIPGVFQLTHPLSDEQLGKISNSIAQIHACLKSGKPCGYPVDAKFMASHAYEYIPAVSVKNLLAAGLGNHSESGGECFSVTLAEDLPFAGMFVMSFCMKGDAITKVSMDDMILD